VSNYATLCGVPAPARRGAGPWPRPFAAGPATAAETSSGRRGYVRRREAWWLRQLGRASHGERGAV